MMNDGITSGLIPKHKVISSACPVQLTYLVFSREFVDFLVKQERTDHRYELIYIIYVMFQSVINIYTR